MLVGNRHEVYLRDVVLPRKWENKSFDYDGYVTFGYKDELDGQSNWLSIPTYVVNRQHKENGLIIFTCAANRGAHIAFCGTADSTKNIGVYHMEWVILDLHPRGWRVYSAQFVSLKVLDYKTIRTENFDKPWVVEETSGELFELRMMTEW